VGILLAIERTEPGNVRVKFKDGSDWTGLKIWGKLRIRGKQSERAKYWLDQSLSEALKGKNWRVWFAVEKFPSMEDRVRIAGPN
jgi:dsDNA-specific endonuclease/ATPase MutS2